MRASAAAAAALLLAACGGQDGNRAGGATNNASAPTAGEPGAPSAAPPAASGTETMQPGQWEMAVQVRSIEVPGAPPQAQAQIRSGVGRTQTNQDCLTPERARNPLQDMRQMMAQGRAANCRFTDQVFGGGVIRIRATCPGPAGQGSSAQVSMEGSFTGTTLQATLAISAQGANPAMPGATGMRMTADIRGRRVGECRARPAPPAIMPTPAPPPRP